MTNERSDNPEKLLERDHAESHQLLGELVDALTGGDSELSFRLLDLFWARLAMHIRAEHLHLFPSITNALDEQQHPQVTQTTSAIGELREDHDFFMKQLAIAIKLMREDQNMPQVERLAEVRRIVAAVSAKLERHNAVEENVIYGLPQELLTDSQRIALASEIFRELENVPPRFGR